MKSIGNYAFERCDLKEIVSKIDSPFQISTNTFSNNTFDNATLYVPVGSIEQYKETKGWYRFVHIKEGVPSSITGLEGEWIMNLNRYTLDGRVVNIPHKGINIIRMDNGTAKKVFIK